MIVNLPRSHLINGFLRRDCRLSSSCGTEPRALYLAGAARASKRTVFPRRVPPPCGPGHPGQIPTVGRSSSFTMNSVHLPCSFLSVTVGLVCWLKGDSGSLALAEGGGRDVQGKPEEKAIRSVTSVTLKILGQDRPVRQFIWGHSAVSPLFWLSLLGVCCRPP